MSAPDLLFVYGTLRAGYDDPMAAWLHAAGRLAGRGRARGSLYRVDDYPGMVADDGGWVIGDIVVLDDPAAALAILDEHEQCSESWPEPREYRRERIMVVSDKHDPIEAWTYIYAHDARALERIGSGDFLR
ncbi:gamma-glutamylcyclotransferase family protein [Sphingobium sp. AN641]|uniref:gamma-glutamylcyclotransferase family protein n=1 Tax=Sphingobium sp. AN641 TaxID=3133443 RepID=UPI0030BD185F